MRPTSNLDRLAQRVGEFISVSATATRPEPGAGVPGETHFAALALELFRLQFEQCAPYRKLCEGRGLSPRNIEHWTRIPAAPTAAFKEFELTSLPPGDRTAVFHSSGTSAQRPSRHFHSAKSLGLYEASLVPWFERHLLSDWPGGTLVSLTPPRRDAPNSSLVHMFDFIAHRFGAGESVFAGTLQGDGTWAVDFDIAAAALGRAQSSQRPVLLLGAAFLFVHLLDFLQQENLRFELPPGSRVLETGGYKGRSRALPKGELHQLISKRLGIPRTHILCEYGMSELSSQAYDRVAGSDSAAHSRAFRFPPWARAVIISPETGSEVAIGQTGLVRVIDLANVYSVMAVQTEDLAVRQTNGFELLGRAALAEPRGCSLMAS